jgi:hypothetical protein
MDYKQKNQKMKNFDIDFTLNCEYKDRKTDEFELKQFVDMAVIWNCIPEQNFDDVYGQLSNISLNKRNVKYSCHLNIPKGIMDKMFNGIAKPESLIIQDSLSEAVPYNDYNFRKSPSLRKIAYNSIWGKYLNDRPVYPSEIKQFATTCGNHLQEFDLKLAQWEAQYLSTSTTSDHGSVSFIGLIEFFSVYQIIDRIKNGAGIIDDMKSYSFSNLKQGFKSIDDIFKFKGAKDNYFHLNFFARYLLNIAQSLGVADKIETVATVEYEDENNQVKKLICSLHK